MAVFRRLTLPLAGAALVLQAVVTLHAPDTEASLCCVSTGTFLEALAAAGLGGSDEDGTDKLDFLKKKKEEEIVKTWMGCGLHTRIKHYMTGLRGT